MSGDELSWLEPRAAKVKVDTSLTSHPAMARRMMEGEAQGPRLNPLVATTTIRIKPSSSQSDVSPSQSGFVLVFLA